MRVLTVTLNPAYDLYCRIPTLTLYRENKVNEVVTCAGGKGVNVSRALHAFGCDTTAYVVIGEENGFAMEASLREEGIDYVPFPVPGRIRENYTILPDAEPETRLCFDTFFAGDSLLTRVLDRIRADLAEEKEEVMIAFSGKLPRGIGKDAACAFLKELRSLSSHLILDTNSLTPDEIVTVQPWLIKPNEQEIELFVGKKIESREELIRAAALLHQRGIAHVLITLGGDGAVYAGEDGILTATVPSLHPLSTVGAGDSTIAGFAAATTKHMFGNPRLISALAFGSAACLREGTAAPLPEDVTKLSGEIKVTRIA